MAFDRREQNRKIFEDAMRLCKTNKQLRQAIEASKAKQYVVADNEEIAAEEGRRFDAPAKVVVSRKRSLEAAGNKAYEGLKVCVHNFASATNPGGGVVNGASAQEECICRCSTLYPNINTYAVRSAFHEKHKMLLRQGEMDAAYNDDCIFTPEIVVFKTDDDKCKTMEKAQWYLVDVITCAAPNLRKKPSNAMNPNSGTKALEISSEQLQKLHEKRLRRILTIAKKEQEDVVI
ncbi:MAG: TIGR02452 family protein, partial [Lachnospiraceae bacterium]|nr:TIGR02452 family protein [Lachnospiraceae bacterium]